MDASAYIVVKPLDLTYRFTGITSVEHSFSLKLPDPSDSTSESGAVSGAKKQPDRVTLSVVESDASRQPGWAARMLDVLAAVHARQLLCRVVTAYHTYENMLLSSVSAVQDASNQAGWRGTLTFTETAAVPDTAAAAASAATSGPGQPTGSDLDTGIPSAKAANQSSTPKNVGAAAPAKTVSGSPLQQMLRGSAIAL